VGTRSDGGESGPDERASVWLRSWCGVAHVLKDYRGRVESRCSAVAQRLPIQTIARVPVQQQSPGLKGLSEELPQANFWLQYWHMGQEPAG
jgi:hypothetical protein